MNFMGRRCIVETIIGSVHHGVVLSEPWIKHNQYVLTIRYTDEGNMGEVHDVNMEYVYIYSLTLPFPGE